MNIKEIEQFYLPISKLLNFCIISKQKFYKSTYNFLNNNKKHTPFIIGIAGSVAVGKSTIARILYELLIIWNDNIKVELLNTDGFLQPNIWLCNHGLMEKKGFPESYNYAFLLEFLSDIKSGKQNVKAPTYSHLMYDIIPNKYIKYDQPDILIVEGLNVLQACVLSKNSKKIFYASDYFDFSIFIDANEEIIAKWYIDRFLTFRKSAFTNPSSYFHKYTFLNDDEAIITGKKIWKNINRKNLYENIYPTWMQANLIIKKGSNHLIEKIFFRKI